MENKIIKLRYISKLLFLILVFSCKNEIKDVKLINKINNNDSIFDDLSSSNRIKNDYLFFKKDTLIWYNIYDSKTKKIKQKAEIHYSNYDTPVINQYITFNSKGLINVNKSYYIDLSISDTIMKGESIHSLKFIGKVDKDRTLLACGIENTYANETRIDSFRGNNDKNNKVLFRINSLNNGNKIINGFLLQQIMITSKINDTMSKLVLKNEKVYFRKKVYVKPSSL